MKTHTPTEEEFNAFCEWVQWVEGAQPDATSYKLSTQDFQSVKMLLNRLQSYSDDVAMMDQARARIKELEEGIDRAITLDGQNMPNPTRCLETIMLRGNPKWEKREFTPEEMQFWFEEAEKPNPEVDAILALTPDTVEELLSKDANSPTPGSASL